MKRLSIAQIREELAGRKVLSAQERRDLESDSRKGVRRLLVTWEKRRQHDRQRLTRYREMSCYEKDWRGRGKTRIAGVDEAGRGPLAGPVVAASVIFKPDTVLLGVNDSKQLTEARRDMLFGRIKSEALSVGVGIVTAHEIDRMNIYQAAKKAMTEAIEAMSPEPDHLLIDAMELPLNISQTSLIKGDARSISIAAASIVAKVTRDRLMCDLDRKYPGYGFSEHKGYPTPAHLEALRRLGPCPEHRMTFAPLKNI